MFNNAHTIVISHYCTEMYPECLIAAWDALILLLDAEHNE